MLYSSSFLPLTVNVMFSEAMSIKSTGASPVFSTSTSMVQFCRAPELISVKDVRIASIDKVAPSSKVIRVVLFVPGSTILFTTDLEFIIQNLTEEIIPGQTQHHLNIISQNLISHIHQLARMVIIFFLCRIWMAAMVVPIFMFVKMKMETGELHKIWVRILIHQGTNIFHLYTVQVDYIFHPTSMEVLGG